MKNSIGITAVIAALLLSACAGGQTPNPPTSSPLPALQSPSTPANPTPAQPAAAAPVTGNLEGNAAPEFKLNDINGNPVSLSDFRGKVVLLNFWATW